jgi:hypothetical protein
MKKELIAQAKVKHVEDIKFDYGFDYCLVTPENKDVALYYFNKNESTAIMLKVTSNIIPINVNNSILFCLGENTDIMPPKLGCAIAINKPY